MDAFQPEIIKQLCIDSGFDLVGFAKPILPDFHREYLLSWVRDQKFGKMTWFPKEQSMEIRTDFRHLGFKPASMICLGMVYRSEWGESTLETLDSKVSRYALGEDYHEVLRKKAEPILRYLRQAFPKNYFRQSVDTLPIMEKVFAVKAGIGWMGKNTNVIHTELGSYFFISTILTDCPWLVVEPVPTDHCGSCTSCLDACPTGALTAPYQLDASLCISHHTIEDRDPIFETGVELSGWQYGCDICQEVCPWNQTKAKRNQIETKNQELLPKGIFAKVSGSLDLEMSEEDFRHHFKQTSIYRIGVDAWNRNVKKLREKRGDQSVKEAK